MFPICSVSVDSLATDIRGLDDKVCRLATSVDTIGKDFKRQMEGFLQVARTDMAELSEDLKDAESLRLELADFFCEDERTFKLEECFRILQEFCDRFNKVKLVRRTSLLVVYISAKILVQRCDFDMTFHLIHPFNL